MLLVTNSQILTDLFIIEEPEINLLCSIERPLVKLKLKNIDENISSSGYIFTRLVNSSKEVELSKALKIYEMTKVIKKCRLATLIGKINFKVEDYSKAPAV